MKKILFTLLLVAGGFVTQAQNTITFGTWATNGENYGLAVSEENQACFNDAQMTDKNEVTYSWDGSTLSFGGSNYSISGTQAGIYNRDFGNELFFLARLTANKQGLASGTQPAQPTAIPAN